MRKQANREHRLGRIAFALLVGLSVAVFSYRWVTDPTGREQRVVEERVVETSRTHLRQIVAAANLEIVDPLSPNRKVGKVYVYPEGESWEISGYYRRDENDHWHPYLMSMDSALAMTYLKTSDKDPAFLERAKLNPLLELLN